MAVEQRDRRISPPKEMPDLQWQQQTGRCYQLFPEN